MVNWKNFWTKNTLLGLGLGQLLSLLITSTGFSSSALANQGINAPTSQSFLNYVLLAVVYGSIMLYRKQALKAKWYYYALLGLIDVEGNFLGIPVHLNYKCHAARLLDNTMCPVSHLVLSEDKVQIEEVCWCSNLCGGLVIVVFSDVHAADRSSGSNPIKGDLLVIAGATLYGVSNVSEEYFVKSADRIELMAFLGIFGAIVSAIQMGDKSDQNAGEVADELKQFDEEASTGRPDQHENTEREANVQKMNSLCIPPEASFRPLPEQHAPIPPKPPDRPHPYLRATSKTINTISNKLPLTHFTLPSLGNTSTVSTTNFQSSTLTPEVDESYL
ncbi:Solute carrier family 35 member F1 [Sesamum angolense]|uniref:Solute carrier family 35 member F1 n=1 Tax=Sesamum angolense TaxID=2727404 RepID=A0AAE1T5E1_9LAMI|nr:Solute carrier family 35 member F1 [Sesamum angolense]